MLKGLLNAIESVTVVGTDQALTHKVVGKISWSPVPGIVYIPVPESVQDKYMSVLKLRLKGPLRLYRGKGGL